MSDLQALMREAAPRLTATAETDVDADVARGRRSLRVRRGRRAASISGIGAAVLIGALAVANVHEWRPARPWPRRPRPAW